MQCYLMTEYWSNKTQQNSTKPTKPTKLNKTEVF